MRVLFLIPKSNPPELQGNFSKLFKEFVARCLNKDPKNVGVVGIVVVVVVDDILFIIETRC